MVYLMVRRSCAYLYLSLFFLGLSLLFCGQARAGNRRHALMFDHYKRYYFVHIPPRHSGRLALIINLHAAGSQGRGQEEFSNMDKTADKYGFYVVYPNGSGRLRNRYLTWNAGACCGYAYEQRTDDVAFLRRMLDAVIKQYPIDPQRIYVTGMSNGAMMAYYLAQKLPERIAAIAPVAGGLMPSAAKQIRPMPILHFNSIAEPQARNHTGSGPSRALAQQHDMHPDINAVLAAWAKINGCSTQRKLITRRVAARAKQTRVARMFQYTQCRYAPVAVWQYDQAGHVWPGGKQNDLGRSQGPGAHLINANELMWQFFRQYRLRTD